MFDTSIVSEPLEGDDDASVFDDVAWEALLVDGPFEPYPVEPEPEPGFGDCAPSGWSALELDTGTADPGSLSDAEVIDAIVGFDRIGSWASARQARLLAELARRRPADPVPNEDGVSVGSRFVPDEVGVALKLARGTAAGRVGTACRLLRVLPDTHALWEAGLIDTAKARAVDEATTVLSDELAAKVEARVLGRAPEQSLAQLRAALARAILAADPDGAADRHKQARKDRRVHVQPEADGMGSLWALLTASDAAGAYQWLTRLARGLGKDDPRTMDARRADLLAELLNGRLVPDVETVDPDPESADDSRTDDSRAGDSQADGSRADNPAGDSPVGESAGCGDSDGPSRRVRARPVTPGKPLIQVVIAHSTLTGADDQPAELAGHGPIPAQLARDIAAGGVWRRLVTDPLSGTVLDYGRSTYHPPAALADHIRARDLHCRFPLCRRRAADAELDHILAWADGGQTSEANLGAYCLHHHKLKHHGGWKVQAHPDGRLTWTTPTGHRHTTSPHDYGPEPPGASAPSAPPPTDSPDPVDVVDVDVDPPPF